jgi:hypothetical protein
MDLCLSRFEWIREISRWISELQKKSAQVLNLEDFWVTAFADTVRGSWAGDYSKRYSECPELDNAFKSFGTLIKYSSLIKDEGNEEAFVNEMRTYLFKAMPFRGCRGNCPWQTNGLHNQRTDLPGAPATLRLEMARASSMAS